MANLATLIPFKPGFDERRNLGGRPKKDPAIESAKDQVKKLGWAEMLEAISSPDTRIETKLAILREAEDRTVGKPAQTVNANLTERRPIVFDPSLNETVDDEANGEAEAAVPQAQ